MMAIADYLDACQDYSRKDTFRDLADKWVETHHDKKRISDKRVARVGGQNVMAWSLEARDKTTGALVSVLNRQRGKPPRSKPKIRHLRWCQRCKRQTGMVLFCSKCPVVMHR